MKKSRLIVGLILVAVMVFAAGFGSAAFFSHTYSTSGNTVTADEFVITPTGVDEPGLTKTFSIDKFAPGDIGKYEFFVNRKTTLPVKYEVTVSDDRGLPLTYSLKANGRNYGVLDSSNGWAKGNIAMSTSGTYDQFVLSYEWPYEGDSNAYEGKTSTISVTLKAIQQPTSTANVEYMQGYVYNYTTGQAETTSVRVIWDAGNIVGFEFYSPVSNGKVTFNGTTFIGDAAFISGLPTTASYDSGRAVWSFNASGNHGIEIHR